MALKTLIVLLLCLAAAHARQTVREASQYARQVVSDAGVGTFLTHMHDTLEGSGDCTDHPGDLLLYMSELQMSVRNMHHNPDRVAFTVRALQVYDNPKMGNGSSIVELPRLTLFGAMEPIPASKVHIFTYRF
ncbi:hypothetical protein BJV82DRAFT_578587 [Fennellomyces sp. T-0311]|nr:hypothetical protein BJV82DRAFT_578587 [Fennellomyces sp. T-0311]